MKYIGNLQDTKEFTVTDEYIYCSGNNLHVYNNLLKLVYTINCQCFTVEKFGNNVLFQIENGQSMYLIRGACHSNIAREKYYLFRNIISSETIFILRDDDLITQFDYNLQEIKTHSIGRFPKMIFSNKTIRLPNLSIVCCDLDSNIQLWQHSFSELLPPIQTADNLFQNGNMIIHNGCLYFSLFENNRHLNTATICIDIETGKVENIFKGFAGNLSLFGNNIGIVSNTTIQILNTKSNSIIIKDYPELLQKEKIYLGWNSFLISEDELMYFIGNGQGMGSHVGIIDLKTDELVWLHGLNPNKEIYEVAARDIKISDDRLYVHCSDNTLHIFENEK